MIKERTDERYEFQCPHCGARWSRDYRVQRSVDHRGYTWESYSRNGLPAMVPLGVGSVACTTCGAEHLYARRVAMQALSPLED